MKRSMIKLLSVIALVLISQSARAEGTILRQVWAELGGTTVNDLTGFEDFPNYPTSSSQLNQFEAPSDSDDGYGARIVGYIHPPATGNYTFWIASDDASELWLSTSEDPKDKQKLCFVSEWTPPKAYTTKPEQQSKPVALTAGKKYYVEALHKEGGGGDNLSVAWKLPDGKEDKPIPGKYLSPWVPPSVPPKAAKPPPPPPTAHGQWKQKFETKVGDRNVKMSYLLYLPKGYETTSDKKPMVVFLHGAGECGTDLGAIIGSHGPSGEMERNPKLKDQFNFIVLSPQCPGGTRWDTPGQAQAVVKLIDEVSEKYRVDKDKVYVTGLSMGGKGTWLVAHASPGHFAAFAPISAIAVEPEKAVERFKKVPIWIICGANDGGFTEGSKQMAKVLKDGGCPVELMVFPNEGHGVWARYYPDPKFYEWLLKHTRQK